MKTQLEAGDIELLQACFAKGFCRADLKQTIRGILAEVELAQDFDAEMGHQIANACRDVALELESRDLQHAQQMMSLALSIRPSGPVLQQKTREYEGLLQVSGAGVAKVNGIELSFGEHPPVPLLRALANGSYEQHEAKLLLQFIGPKDRVLELGAGIGYMGVQAMTHCKPLSYTAYEANPALLPFIGRNMERNGVQFDARNALLGNENGQRTFYVTPAFWASSLLKPDSGPYEPVSVPSVDKSAVMEELQPTALVVDIEGGEAEFFTGLDLSSVNKIIMEIHPAVLDDAMLSGLYQRLLGEGFILNFAVSSKVVTYWYR